MVNMKNTYLLNIRAFWLFTRLKFYQQLSFKTNLIIQAVGMLVNNFILILVWYFLIQRFGNINGYGMADILFLNGYVAIFYAIFFWFLGGLDKLGTYLHQDKFLDLQLLPVNPLVTLLARSGNPSQLGDLLSGLVFMVVSYILQSYEIHIFVLSLVVCLMAFLAVSIIVNSSSFWLQNQRNIFSDLMFNLYIGASFYPSQNFFGWRRLLLYVLLVFPVVYYPVEVARGFFDPSYLLISLMVTIVAFIVGLSIWRRGIKLVESGSGGGAVE
jgi:ABC-type uncharacterized transport system permease subunit